METTRRTAVWKRWLSVFGYGLVTSLYGPSTAPRTLRRRFERLASASRERVKAKYPNVAFADHRAGDLAIEAVCAVPGPRRVVLYLHGGAYLFGSLESYRDRARVVSYRADAEVFVPDYRLAPEHPYPAALDDALAAFAYVRETRPDLPIVVAGDSAGGGLALALLAALRARGEALPSAAFVFSAWTDLAGTGASVAANASRDVWLGRRHLEAWARHYVGDADPRDPGISPLHGDLAGLPPVLLVVGEHEILLDDTLRFEAKARAAGVDATALVGRAMQHDFPLTLPWLAESREAWSVVAAFLERSAGGARPADLGKRAYDGRLTRLRGAPSAAPSRPTLSRTPLPRASSRARG